MTICDRRRCGGGGAGTVPADGGGGGTDGVSGPGCLSSRARHRARQALTQSFPGMSPALRRAANDRLASAALKIRAAVRRRRRRPDLCALYGVTADRGGGHWRPVGAGSLADRGSERTPCHPASPRHDLGNTRVWISADRGGPGGQWTSR